jgi:hypothetical protein
MHKRDERERREVDDRTRWETDGGATTTGPQPPGVTF